jgi:putative PIN family toxin of toxin-antitoxin system
VRVVLDTNVLVSGLLSPNGPPGEILRLLESRPIVPCFNRTILAEYRDVLARPHFRLSADRVARLLHLVEAVGELVIGQPLLEKLPDPDDEAFLEVALEARADFLVTGNLRHFPARLRQGIAVVSPRDFLEARARPR